MPAPLFDLDGLLRGDAVLTIEEALDHATADPVRGVLVPMLGPLAAPRTAWTARLRTDDAAPAAPVRSIRAMSFAPFVGLS